MFRKALILGIVGAGVVLSAVGLSFPMSVWGATIQCKSTSNPCFGTVDESNTMIGDDGKNVMLGGNKADSMSGKGGFDDMSGGNGNDVMSGGNGNDAVSGGLGSDRLSGGEGDDEISHSGTGSLNPDGSRDYVDCGSGNDEAFINVRVDHDLAVNCETVHTDNGGVGQTTPNTGTLIVTKVCSFTTHTCPSGDFTIKVTGNNPSPESFQGSALGTQVTLGPGPYKVSEEEEGGFLIIFSGNCKQTGVFTDSATGNIKAGETQTCKITNRGL